MPRSSRRCSAGALRLRQFAAGRAGAGAISSSLTPYSAASAAELLGRVAHAERPAEGQREAAAFEQHRQRRGVELLQRRGVDEHLAVALKRSAW